ncbi:uncharacterized protein ELE39_001665 [Cryptosporidium sp. chipmunk genotype I]|uniref:uncharacterized protein n=1 Tax=Cryptosporidium sp. chipmunk genotype I TaxID=1280935 RepID=UPI00351A09FB|nr:hypothetical protein ELE39_001665 [Cryptosporidium sp. chipmunk genotype I]
MLILNLEILFVIIINLTSFSIGEQQLSPNEFLQYFSTAANINSLIFSLSNMIYSIKRFNKLKKRNRGFNEGINESVNRSKELKLKNQIINNQFNNLLSAEDSCLSNEVLDRNEIDIIQLIIQSSELADIYMVKDNIFLNRSNITDLELNESKSINEYFGKQIFFSNYSKVENTKNTNVQNIDFNNNINTRKLRGLVIE